MAKRLTKATSKKAAVKKGKPSLKNSDKFFLEITSRLQNNDAIKQKSTKKVASKPKKSSKESFYQQTSRSKKAKPAAASKKVTKVATKAATRTRPTKVASKVKRARKADLDDSFLASAEEDAPKTSRFRVSKKLSLLVLLVGVIALVILLGNKFLVVAWVDKKPITRLEFYQGMEKKYGNDIKEQMIVEKLITSEASKRGVSVSEPEVSAEIKKFEDEQGGADKLNQILQLQGLSKDDLNRLVKLQLLKQKMFGADIKVSDDQVSQYMEQNKDQLPDLSSSDASTSAKIKGQIADQIKQQQINQNFQAWLTQNLQSNRVIRN
jgi:hypothetical protein